MNNYQKALQLCVSKDDWRKDLLNPFLVEDKIMSSNGHILYIVPYALIGQPYELFPRPNAILENIPKPLENPILTVTRAFMNKIMTDCPQIDDYDEQGKDVDCDACDGYGNVDYEFEYKLKTYTENLDCPVCDGSGLQEKVEKKPNGKKIPNPETIIEIHNSQFFLYNIDILLKICELMESDAVLISQESDMKPSLFQIGETQLLVMPIYKDSEKHPFCSIK